MIFLRRFVFLPGHNVLYPADPVCLPFSGFIKQLRIKEIVEREIEHSLGINVTIERLEFSPLLRISEPMA